MSNEESLIDDELKIKIPTRAKIITVIWLLICIISFFFWLNFFYDKEVNSVSLGDIGAFLSGVFSVLAFYGFIEAYLIQSQELRLQRFELKESIKAQKGSEQALKEQSKALNAQLEITAKQFDIYLKDIELKRPIFSIYEGSDYSDSSNNLSMVIMNLAGECILTNVSQKKVTGIRLSIVTKVHIIRRVSFNHMMNNQSSPEYPDLSKFDVSFFYHEEDSSQNIEINNLYKNLELIFHYSYSGTSGTSLYKLNKTDNYIDGKAELELDFVRHIV